MGTGNPTRKGDFGLMPAFVPQRVYRPAPLQRNRIAALDASGCEESLRGLRFLSFRLFAGAFGERKGWGAAGLLPRLGLLAVAGIGWRTAGVLSRLLGLLRLLCLLLRGLDLLGGHDAEIMLRMLKIILSHHPVAAGIGVAGELEIFLIDMAGGAPDFDLRPRGIESTVGIETTAGVMTTAVTVLRPATASA